MACAGGADGRARSGGTVVVESVYETPCKCATSAYTISRQIELEEW